MGAISSGWKVVVPLNCGVFSMWVGMDQWLGWGNLCLCSGGWSWISSLWSRMKSTVEFWGVYGFSMALGSPHFNVQGCVPVLLEKCLLFSMVCLVT